VDVYASEEEQVEAIKKWWQQNGKAIITGLIIGLGALSGWRYWQTYTVNKETQSSIAYQQVMSNIADHKLDAAKASGDKLIHDFSGSSYADLSALILAKLAMEENDLVKAHGYLQRVADQTSMEELRHIALIRLARIELADGHAEAALARLDTIEGGDQLMSWLELKGDVQVALQQQDGARNSYLQALSLAESNGANKVLLQLKLDDLGQPGRTP